MCKYLSVIQVSQKLFMWYGKCVINKSKIIALVFTYQSRGTTLGRRLVKMKHTFTILSTKECAPSSVLKN